MKRAIGNLRGVWRTRGRGSGKRMTGVERDVREFDSETGLLEGGRWGMRRRDSWSMDGKIGMYSWGRAEGRPRGYVDRCVRECGERPEDLGDPDGK